MSEITREQVERALAEVRKHAPRDDHDIGVAQAMLRIFGNGWLSVCPRYVAEPFDILGTRQDAFRAALERWLATFPAPVAEDSPERLRQRREALGLNQAQAAHDLGLPLLWHDLDALETAYQTDDADRKAYAAALTAEEQRRAAEKAKLLRGKLGTKFGPVDEPVRKVARWDASIGRYVLTPPCVLTTLPAPVASTHARADCIAWGYEIEGEPAPPEPRFKVGDWVRVVRNGTVYQVGEVATPFGGTAYFFRETGGAENSWQAAALEPAAAPTLEVVDVPQPIPPIVKRYGPIEARWHHGANLIHVTTDGMDDGVPIALMEAMVDAIRATRDWDAIKAHHARWDAQLDAPQLEQLLGEGA